MICRPHSSMKTELEKGTLPDSVANAITECLSIINGSSKIQLMLVNNMLGKFHKSSLIDKQ
jgi:hypothetical protein